MPAHLPIEPHATAADWASAHALLWDGSRTFMSASLLLPDRVRQAAVGLYAFCRTADDAVDNGGDAASAIAALKVRVEDIFAGKPQSAADRTFADVVTRYSIPRAYPDALIEGFEWDAVGRRYETIEEVTAYAMRVAGVVGAMMAMVMGVQDEPRVARACDLGVAMQLTNIARDVGEDARNGRLYLPLEWMRNAGIDASDWLKAPCFDHRLAQVIERLLHTADGLYCRSESGLRALPTNCRTGMFAARYLYAHIGEEVRRLGYDSVGQRAVVHPAAKGRLLCKAILASVKESSQRDVDGSMLPQAAFVLSALSRPAGEADTLPTRFALTRRVVGVFDMFERLARRDGSRATAGV